MIENVWALFPLGSWFENSLWGKFLFCCVWRKCVGELFGGRAIASCILRYSKLLPSCALNPILTSGRLSLWIFWLKAEHQRTDAFKLWCWRRLWRVPWTARRPNQLILNEIDTEYSLEGLMLKLKFQYYGHLMRRANSLEKTLMMGKTEGRRRSGQQRMRR